MLTNSTPSWLLTIALAVASRSFGGIGDHEPPDHSDRLERTNERWAAEAAAKRQAAEAESQQRAAVAATEQRVAEAAARQRDSEVSAQRDAAEAERRRAEIIGVIEAYRGHCLGLKPGQGFRPSSLAHQRGAVDISSKDMTPEARHKEAQDLSGLLGPCYDVVVEEVTGTMQKNTTYRNGAKGRTRSDLPLTVSATHTHIQPAIKCPMKPSPSIRSPRSGIVTLVPTVPGTATSAPPQQKPPPIVTDHDRGGERDAGLGDVRGQPGNGHEPGLEPGRRHG